MSRPSPIGVSASSSVPGWLASHWLALAVVLVVAFVVRLFVWSQTAHMALNIVDEVHYAKLAASLSLGHGFGWGPEHPVSIRPPLYPFLVSQLWNAGGTVYDLQLIRFAQILLALVTTWLLFVLGRNAFGVNVGVASAGLYALYPTLIAYDSLLLTEGLFNFFVILSCLIYQYMASQTAMSRVLALALGLGLVLGAAALTRSIAWPFLLLLAPSLLFVIKTAWLSRIGAIALLLAGFATVVGPWAARNSELQGTPVLVDTMGGMNLYMGNYEHTPLNRAWDAIGLRGDKFWATKMHEENSDASTWTEGQREAWAKKAAVAFMLENPGLTIHRSLIKFANFWGLEREIIAGFSKGNFRLGGVGVLVITALILLSYVTLTMVGVTGIAVRGLEGGALSVYLAIFAFTIVGIHSLVFGHSRYHLPLVPFFCIFASAFVFGRAWRGFDLRRPSWLISAAAIVLLIGIWIREVVVVEADRIAKFVEAMGW